MFPLKPLHIVAWWCYRLWQPAWLWTTAQRAKQYVACGTVARNLPLCGCPTSGVHAGVHAWADFEAGLHAVPGAWAALGGGHEEHRRCLGTHLLACRPLCPIAGRGLCRDFFCHRKPPYFG